MSEAATLERPAPWHNGGQSVMHNDCIHPHAPRAQRCKPCRDAALRARMAETAAARFWAKVDKTDTCWLWRAAAKSEGYGSFRVGQRATPAHRWAYEQARGPIPPGLDLDHLCRVPRCVNPDHLEPVTRQINILRGQGFAARNAVVTHCPRGHAYDEANTYIRPKGNRMCRACHRIDEARRRAR